MNEIHLYDKIPKLRFRLSGTTIMLNGFYFGSVEPYGLELYSSCDFIRGKPLIIGVDII